MRTVWAAQANSVSWGTSSPTAGYRTRNVMSVLWEKWTQMEESPLEYQNHIIKEYHRIRKIGKTSKITSSLFLSSECPLPDTPRDLYSNCIQLFCQLPKNKTTTTSLSPHPSMTLIICFLVHTMLLRVTAAITKALGQKGFLSRKSKCGFYTAW